MSIQSVSGSSAWQTLAELQAARDAAATPDASGTQAAPWTSTTPGSSPAAAGATPAPQPPTSVLQFFQQLQSVDQGTASASPTPAGTGATLPGGDISGLLADLQSLQSTLQGGTAGTDAGSAPTSTTTLAGSTDPGATQTGSEFALQWLSGLQGTAAQFGGAYGLAALGA